MYIPYKITNWNIIIKVTVLPKPLDHFHLIEGKKNFVNNFIDT